MQQKARQWITSGAVATVIGALVLAANFGEVGAAAGATKRTKQSAQYGAQSAELGH